MTASDLVVKLEVARPSSLPSGSAAAIFCLGSCFHRHQQIDGVELIVDGVRHRATAFGMPRPDVLRSVDQDGLPEAPPGGRADLRVRSYLSGFWATVPARASGAADQIELQVAARLASGAESLSRLGSINVLEADPPPSSTTDGDRSGEQLIAICMATFEPDMRLFRTQIESLRAQTDERWVCLISDDRSSPERFEQIRDVVGADRRFVVSPSRTRLGFYRNFERALRMVPAEAELVALSDQDDRWHPDKLRVLRESLGDARLVYSDQRLVDPEGRVLRNTLWKGRRNNYRNLASQLVAGTIGGAAMLFRRELLDVALPFPQGPGFLFHDHWLGLAAMASGEVAFVERPLYDYVQHAGAVLGNVTHGPRRPPAASTRRTPLLRPWRGAIDRWRPAYFYGFLSREVLAQTLLVRCSSELSARDRRVLKRFIASARSPAAFAWLALRPLRAVLGRNETLGSEADLTRGIVWSWLTRIRARRVGAASRMVYDAALPDPASFEQKRLRRWRARLD